MRRVSLPLFLLLAASTANGQWLEATIPLPHSPTPCDACLHATNNCLYVCGWESDTVSVIAADSNVVVALVPVGSHPTGIVSNPVRNRLYTLNSWDLTMTVINGYNNAALEDVELNRSPDRLFCNPLANRIYCTGVDIDNPTLAAFECYNNDMTACFSLPNWSPVSCPSTTSSRTYVVAGETTIVIDQDQVVTQLRSPRRHTVMCYNPLRDRLYEADGDDGHLEVIDCATDSVVARCSLGLGLTCACYVPRWDLVCFTSFEGILAVYDCAADSVTARCSAGRPIGVSVCDSIAGKVYTLGGDSVAVFDVAAARFIGNVTVGFGTCRLVWSAPSRRVFVVNRDGNSVSVIRDTAVAGAVDETTSPEVRTATAPTVLHRLPGGSVVFDAMGRRVLNPKPGVCFVRPAGGRSSSPCRKVVLTN